MSRRNAREAVFKLVFEYTFSKERNPDTLEMFLTDASLSDDDKQYIQNTYDGIMTNYDALYATVAECSEGYAPDRIYRPDLVALLLSTYELTYLPDVPSAVSISEAVELVKRFSSEKSNVFVNGVLATVLKKVRA